MKAQKALELVLQNGNENAGIAVSGLFETVVEFVERWFGEGSLASGGYVNNSKYLYYYDDWGYDRVVADLIVNTPDGCKIHLYKLDD